ncbi:MAG: hypothetical protein IJ856_06870, partial [Candidatus Methanomethylophilaceae archaeon]|nr:hypothetical protein [Candidatus Methanomethylophilaceae archaeon]
RKKKGWDFLYLGANIDVGGEAVKIGISENNAVSYECSVDGIAGMYCMVEEKVAFARKNGSFSEN